MLSQQPAAGSDDEYVYRRGDIPIFNLDAQDKLLIKTLEDLIEALRYFLGQKPIRIIGIINTQRS